MNNIELKHILPTLFSTRSELDSDIWQKDVVFEKGNTYLINAPSGTGKSSLCSYLCGYRNDYDGRILFDQKNIRQLSTKEWDLCRKSEISVVYQDLKLFEELTVLENLQIKNRLTKHKSLKELHKLLDFLEIKEKIDTPIQQLSLGQQQRVAIIRALCQPYSHILLDEPISHLDEPISQKVAELITDEASKQKASIIVTSLGNDLKLAYKTVYNL